MPNKSPSWFFIWQKMQQAYLSCSKMRFGAISTRLNKFMTNNLPLILTIQREYGGWVKIAIAAGCPRDITSSTYMYHTFNDTANGNTMSDREFCHKMQIPIVWLLIKHYQAYFCRIFQPVSLGVHCSTLQCSSPCTAVSTLTVFCSCHAWFGLIIQLNKFDWIVYILPQVMNWC